MNYCNLDFECEPDSYRDMVKAQESTENILKVLERGEHVLPRVIATIVNWMMFDKLACFCECKKKGWYQRTGKNKGWHSTVYLYTSDHRAIEELLGEVYGAWVELKINGLEDSGNKGWIKIGFSYESLLPVLISSVASMIDVNQEYMDDYEFEDKDIYLAELEEKESCKVR